MCVWFLFLQSDLIKIFENNVITIDQCIKELNQLISKLKAEELAEQFSSLQISIGKQNSVEVSNMLITCSVALAEGMRF